MVFPPRGGRQTPKASDEGDDRRGIENDPLDARPTPVAPSSGLSGHLPPRGGKAVGAMTSSPLAGKGRHGGVAASEYDRATSQGTPPTTPHFPFAVGSAMIECFVSLSRR